jgi:PGF-pre-PGF domain-containing protein
VTVVAGDENTTTTVEIETPDIADPTPGGENNGGGQGAGGVPAGGTTDDDEGETGDTTPTEDGLLNSESQFIVSSNRFGISQVRFTEATPLAAITWETPDIPGELVTVDTYSQPPETVPAVPGDVLSISDVTVPENATDQPATVRYRVEQEALDNVSATSEEATIVRLSDDRWESLDTTVTDETNGTVTLEAATPGFSYIAVTATGPNAVIDAPASAAEGSDITVSATNSTTPFGEIVSYNWTIGNNTYTGASVTTTIDDPDETAIELTVENDAGATDTTTQTLTTSDSTPGFGVIAMLSALLGSALLLRYRALK